jgi:hypothetical protein
MCPSSTGEGSKLILAYFFGDEHPFASYFGVRKLPGFDQ